MKYVACYRQTVAVMLSVEADSIEEAEEKMREAVVDKGKVTLTMADWVEDDDEVRFIDNPSEYEYDCAIHV